MWLLPFAVATCLIVCAALALMLAPLNVYARDTMHLLELIVLGWFWVTPILYQYERAAVWFDQPRARRVGAARQPGHTDRDHVPAGDLRDGGRPDAGRPRRPLPLLPDEGPLWYLAVLAVTALVWGGLLALALRAFDRADVHLAETL